MRYLCEVMYDGHQFQGWQKQPGARTVQTCIEEALYKITKDSIVIHGSGRTDGKVHALGQTFHFDSSLNIPEEGWKRALNAILDKDIHITDVQTVSDSFHARFHVSSKEYTYKLNSGSCNIFDRHYVYQYNKPLNCDAMREAAQYMVGTHDFTSFNATELAIISDQVRTVYQFEITQTPEGIISFHLHGDGFLRYMVRMMVATCVAVGEGKLPASSIPDILNAKDKTAIRYNIDPCGLYLVKVHYQQKEGE